jgi:hypothetical protein
MYVRPSRGPYDPRYLVRLFSVRIVYYLGDGRVPNRRDIRVVGVSAYVTPPIFPQIRNENTVYIHTGIHRLDVGERQKYYNLSICVRGEHRSRTL